MSKTLHYFTRSVYGNAQTYLDTSDATTANIAGYVIALSGRKTLTNSDFQALQGLGFELVQVIDPRNRR